MFKYFHTNIHAEVPSLLSEDLVQSVDPNICERRSEFLKMSRNVLR
jgi:hypothetical protein